MTKGVISFFFFMETLCELSVFCFVCFSIFYFVVALLKYLFLHRAVLFSCNYVFFFIYLFFLLCFLFCINRFIYFIIIASGRSLNFAACYGGDGRVVLLGT